MLLGLHVSAAGGVDKAPENAAKAKAEIFQMFSRPPQGGPAPKLTDAVVAAFRKGMAEHKQAAAYIHTPYYINFASTTPRIRYGSISVVREELERGSLLGVDAVMTHLGSTRAAGPALGLHKTWRSIQRVLDGYEGSTELLLEFSAGGGDTVGDSFEELAFLIENAEKGKPYRGKIGVCWDTCHLFASGYDLRTSASVEATVKQFDRVVGLKRLKLIHANDSAADLGEHRDRHAHIGYGKIGLEGFRAIIKSPKLKAVNFVLETPVDGKRVNDLRTLKRLRDD